MIRRPAILHPGSRPRRPEHAVTERAMDLQIAIAEVERTAAPIWKSAVAMHSRRVLAHCRRLAQLLRASRLEAREIAGIADGAEPMEMAA